MKKRNLLLCTILFFSLTSCSNNNVSNKKIESLSQAFTTINKKVNNTKNTLTNYLNKGNLGIEVNLNYLKNTELNINGKILTNIKNNQENYDVNSNGIFNIKDVDGEYTVSFYEEGFYSKENQLFTFYVDDNKNNEKKKYEFSNYFNIIGEEKNQNLLKVINIILNDEQNRFSKWLANEFTSDQFYKYVLEVINEVYGVNASIFFTKKDQRLFVDTLDVFKDSLLDTILFDGNEKDLILKSNKENLLEFKNNIMKNINLSIKTINNASYSTSYSDYCSYFYNYIKEKIDDIDIDNKEFNDVSIRIKSSNIIEEIELFYNINNETNISEEKINLSFSFSKKEINIPSVTNPEDYILSEK